jgi:sugar lactone lactonase YvrE
MVMDRIERIGKILGTGTQTRLAISGDATWPFSWYLRHYPVNWATNIRNVDQPVVIVDKAVAKSTDKVLLDTYEKVPFQIRAWWEPNWGELDLPKLMRWLLTRVVWSPTGSSDAVMYVYKNPEKGGTEFAKLTVNPPPAARGYPRLPKVIAAAAIWGERGSGRGEFEEPRGLAVDGAGNLYVADSKNHRIQKLAPNGSVVAVWGHEGEGPGEFKDPQAVAIGPGGSVYVADTWNHRIQKFDSDGNFQLEFGKEDPGFWGPRGIAVAPDGNVYVADTGNKRVVSFTADGAHLETWGADGSAPGQFIEPVGIAVDENGQILVADTGNRRIQAFLPDGTFVEEWPVYGWEEFYTEPHMAISGRDVWVTDSYGHRFARYRNEKLTGVWGKSGSGSGEFNRPIGIAVAPPDLVFIADTMNHRIQKFEIGG